MAKHSPLQLVDKDRPIDRLLMPFQVFLRQEASGGILLLVCTAVALVWANSPWGQTYYDFWHTNVGVAIGNYTLSESLAHWVNDGLIRKSPSWRLQPLRGALCDNGPPAIPYASW